MALLSGTVHDVQIKQAPGADSSLGLALVKFTLTGTYDTSLDGDLKTVATLIQNGQRNGKTVTMRAVMAGPHTYRADTGVAIGIMTAAISTADVTFTLCKSTTTAYGTTEFDNSTAVPTLVGPLSFYVLFTEA